MATYSVRSLELSELRIGEGPSKAIEASERVLKVWLAGKRSLDIVKRSCVNLAFELDDELVRYEVGISRLDKRSREGSGEEGKEHR